MNILVTGGAGYIGLHTGYGLAGDALDPIQGLGIAIAVVVQHRHAVARVEQFQAGVAADIAGAAGDKDVHGFSVCGGFGWASCQGCRKLSKKGGIALVPNGAAYTNFASNGADL